MNKFKKLAIAGVLVASMAIGAVAPTFAAVAAQEEVKIIKNYVALGDSMTDGFGFDDFNDPGYQSHVEETYPYQVEKMLESKHENWDVRVAQLAVNAMRPDDLQFLLEYDYVKGVPGVKADYTTRSHWFHETPEILAQTAETYQTAIKNADYITVNLGSNNFFYFLLNNLLSVVGGSGLRFKYDLADQLYGDAPLLKTMVEKIYTTTRSALIKVVGSGSESTIKMVEDLAGALIYASVGLVKTYDACINDIIKLNENKLDLTLIGITNIFDGVIATYSGININLGEIVGFVIDEINSYIASVALNYNTTKLLRKNKNYSVNFVARFADEGQEKDVRVESFFAAFSKGTTNTIRDDFMEDVAETIWPVLEGALPAELKTLYNAKYSRLTYYNEYLDENTPLTGEKGFTVAVYKMVEEALKIVSLDDSVYALDPLIAILTKSLNVAEALGDVNEIFANLTSDDFRPIIMPMAEKIAETPALKCMLYVYSNFLFAGSKGIHPTADGHKAYANSIVNAIEKADKEYTAVGYFTYQVKNNISKVFDFIGNLFKSFFGLFFNFNAIIR